MTTKDLVPSGALPQSSIGDDPSAAQPKPFVHWVLYDVPANPGATREEVIATMKGHVLSKGEIVGTFER